ncbi:carboxypeptidase-like regulatory domain-containing protein [Xanthomarina sp. F1114]|uniref:carboxypeptidase-like regulatory domain-containing protein n=1 Tax=Xanthomarina sp. F1114 TaxID=2996019 RepID=UPI00225DF305|nr:carboxypeptidase-like regulatory domain-containing protein [Xanthomarina sp. F1114]MCX7547550.1 carboxypeptidase-like regulatory domain-containing protein [Xanthomarina sp. F1114]
MRSILPLIFLFVTIRILGQDISVSGSITNHQLQPIESALVLVKSQNNDVLSYTYSNEKGFYLLEFETDTVQLYLIEVSSLGYTTIKREVEINKPTQNINFKMEEQMESLKEVVVEAHQKIRINADTTFIRVSPYTTKTEETVEDVLRRLPGIEILPDGSIKAHGKPIESLLIEGENILGKNYKILSKNLDAKTLEEVQILDHYEENPIFKNLSNSEKVAINLKLKNDFKNIWFGNVSAGYGFKNRYQRAITLGLLKKRIKLLEFSNGNNIGDKAANLLSNDEIVIDLSQMFQHIEKKPFLVFSIDEQENNVFNSRSSFNTSMLHSLGLSSKISERFTVRGSANFVYDKTTQDYQAITQYNTGENSTTFSETNNYQNNNQAGSGELELKYIPNSKNYLTNIIKYTFNPQKAFNGIILGNTNVLQQNDAFSETFYNHLEHTYLLTPNTALYNYLYLGYGSSKESVKIEYPVLNDFLEIENPEPVFQDASDKFNYYGLQSTLLTKRRKWENQLKFYAHMENENASSRLFTKNQNDFEDYTNNLKIDNNFVSVSNAFKYKLKQDNYIRGSFIFTQDWFNKNNYLLKSASLTFRQKLKNIGDIRIGYNYKEDLPKTPMLLYNFALNSYQGFEKGTNKITKLKSSIFSFNYSFYNDIKGFSVNSSVLHTITHLGYATNTSINNNFIFVDLLPYSGGSNTLANASLTSYFSKLKIATKWETSQSFIESPLSDDGEEVFNLKNYSGNYAFSASSYFNKWFNFSGGFSYKFSSSKVDRESNSFKSKKVFLDLNIKISESLKATVNNESYLLENDTYLFLNATITYEPQKSRWSTSLYLNNLFNEEDYLVEQISSFMSYQKLIKLAPAYALFSIKYRF